MSTVHPPAVLVLGGAGFVGRHVVAAIIEAGLPVTALARSESSRRLLEGLGARTTQGDAATPAAWTDELAAAGAVIDLTQPSLPGRLTVRAAREARDERLMTTQALLDAIRGLPADQRPLLVNVSSVQDLAPDDQGRLSGRSAPQIRPTGFSHIGLPVRAAIAASEVDTSFVHFGNLVYGAGKAFADIVDTIRTGRARIIGNGRNRLPLTQAEDAGGAIAHLLTLDRDRIAGRTVVAVPPQPVTQAELYAAAARQLGRPTPKTAPTAVAGLVAGAVNAQTMTLDAICEPDLLTATGYEFRHPTIQTGVPAALAALSTAP